MQVVFEACVDSVESALNASAGGAGRLELCDSLIEGGITPSAGKIRAVVRAVAPLPVHVLVRPRSGDFVYTEVELGIMLDDIDVCKAAGAAGVVTGVLDADGRVNVRDTRLLISRSAPLPVTFHRAIDVSREPLEALKTLVNMTPERPAYILSSGGAATCTLGAATLKEMTRILGEAATSSNPVAADRKMPMGEGAKSGMGGADAMIPAAVAAATVTASAANPPPIPVPILIAGGGVDDVTAEAILAKTGVRQLHGTGKREGKREASTYLSHAERLLCHSLWSLGVMYDA
jgi:copper homeostasis protein CutC